MNTYSKQEAQI